MKKILAILSLAFTAMAPLCAQQKITAHNIKVTAPHTDFNSGMKGLRIDLSLHFTEYRESFFERGFDMDFLLVTPAGQVVFDSKGDHTQFVRADKPSDPSIKAGMVDSDVDLFAPFKSIKLPSGTQKVILVLSLKNDYAQFPEFHKSEISFKQEFIESKTFEQQEFSLSAPEILYNADGFGVDEPGMDIRFKASLRYGADQVDAEKYVVNLQILSPDGAKVLYSAKADPSVHHREKYLRTEDFPGEPVNLSFFVNYVTLQMDGPGDALIVLEAEQPGKGKREIYRHKHSLATPQKYRFDQQVFSPGKVEAIRTMRDGVTGLQFKFHCDFKYNGPLIDHERGDYYFAILITKPGGDTVFSPAQLRRMDYATTSAWSAHDPLLEPKGADADIFVPMHRLRLPAGTHALNYTIIVSDWLRKARFPLIASGSLQVEQPRVLAYSLSVRNLEVIPGNYDTQIAMFGNVNPDLEWRIEVGEDTEYQSPTLENSLYAATGSTTVRLCEGDKLNLGLWDIDSGVFNRNDILGTWTIPYAGKGDKFNHTVEGQGAIRHLSIDIERK